MFTSLLTHLNWLHIIVATVAYFALGALWYSKILFVNPWIKGHNIDINNPDAKKGVALVMLGSFVFFLLTTTGIAILQQLIPSYHLNAVHAVKYSLLIGFLFSFSTMSIGYLYTLKPLSVHLIDGLYHVTGITIAGLILALWK
jgi:hypothetical protein